MLPICLMFSYKFINFNLVSLCYRISVLSSSDFSFEFIALLAASPLFQLFLLFCLLFYFHIILSLLLSYAYSLILCVLFNYLRPDASGCVYF